jgi:hypothetical protein
MTLKTGKRRGRPKGPVKDNPDRYLLARIEAEIVRVEGRFSERKVIKTLVAVAIGQAVDTAENRDRIRRGLPFEMNTLPGRLQARGLQPGRVDDERYRDAFAPYLDDLRRQLRDLRERKDARGDWHRTMVRVFGLVIDGVSIDNARELAESIGERAFFDERLATLMQKSSQDERRADDSRWFLASLRHWGTGRMAKHGARIIFPRTALSRVT